MLLCEELSVQSKELLWGALVNKGVAADAYSSDMSNHTELQHFDSLTHVTHLRPASLHDCTSWWMKVFQLRRVGHRHCETAQQ